jgi:hypothetical protein
LQTIAVSVPLIVILSGISTNGRYIGFSLIFWTFPMSTIILIMLPKVLSFYNIANDSASSRGGRGSPGGIKVSGVPVTNPPTQRDVMMNSLTCNEGDHQLKEASQLSLDDGKRTSGLSMSSVPQEQSAQISSASTSSVHVWVQEFAE